MSANLTSIKVRRFFRRSSNRLIEQIIKAVRKLEKNLEALDREQDELNRLADAEIAAIQQGAVEHRDSLRTAIANSKSKEAEQVAASENIYGGLSQRNAQEHKAASKVRDNLKAILGDDEVAA